MSTPNPDDPQRLGPDPHGDTRPRSHMGSLLWIVVLVALIAMGIWWYSEQTEVAAPQPATTSGQLPPVEARPIAPVAPEDVAADETKVTAAPASVIKPASPKVAAKPPAAVPRDRDPVPLASNRQPKYPGRALRSGVEGSVSVLIEIDARGVPTDVRVVSRSGERSRDLDRAVVSAARGWRFDPAVRDGRPVPGEVILPVDFQRN